jgi:RNA polymerase sigma-70 factor (ECF subfamily)
MKLRSQARRKTCSAEELLPKFDDTGHHVEPVCPWAESAYDRMASDETRSTVRACIDQLPDDYRTVLVLRDIEELDTEQTAAILGLNPGAVKTRLHRARQALRALLAPHMAESSVCTREVDDEQRLKSGHLRSVGEPDASVVVGRFCK